MLSGALDLPYVTQAGQINHKTYFKHNYSTFKLWKGTNIISLWTLYKCFYLLRETYCPYSAQTIKILSSRTCRNQKNKS